MLRKIILLSLLVLSGCRESAKVGKAFAFNISEPRETIEAPQLSIPVYDFPGLEPMLHLRDETIYIVNFWATWCAPCVKEMPYFEQITSEYSQDEVQVILVNLDMPKMWESHLVPFVVERNLRSQVVVLDDPKQNNWIPKVDEGWSGAIPATLIYNKNKRMFYEETFTYDKLKQALSNFKS